MNLAVDPGMGSPGTKTIGHRLRNTQWAMSVETWIYRFVENESRGSARFSRSRCWYGGALDWSSRHWRSISESFHTQRRLGLSKKYPCCVKALGFHYWQNLLLPGHCKPLYTRPREKTPKWPCCDPRSPWETRPWVESRTPPPDLVFLSLQHSVLLCFPTTVEPPRHGIRKS